MTSAGLKALPPARDVPQVGAPSAMKVPSPSVRTLGNGLTVWAVRRPGIPLVQVRMVLPTSRARMAPSDRARQRVLAPALLAGTTRSSRNDLAARLQGMGAAAAAGADAEDFSLSASALSTNLVPLLEMLREVLAESTFPAAEVATEKRRLQEELAMAASQPRTIARLAVTSRVFGSHPYGDRLPSQDEIGRVTRGQLDAYLRRRIGPSGGHLVLVGDLSTNRLLDAGEAALH
ncbi:MAG: insulinase family protein, partial [Acidimicrobiales bacterium]